MSKRRAKLLSSDDSVCAHRRRSIARASVKKGIRLPCLSLLKDMDFKIFFCHRGDAERAEKPERHGESHAEASNIIEISAWSLHERAAGAEKHAEPAAHWLLYEGQPAAQRT